MPIAEVGAAPHLPAGILSPYSDGERGAVVTDFANHQRCKEGACVAAGVQPIDGNTLNRIHR
ncbi:MAG: hypothetical protein E5Y07_17660 [Mesorhizobium sp.]|nr:MAG: hypothetical protein E5Y07_17660 [Mesorhizobium sp.]